MESSGLGQDHAAESDWRPRSAEPPARSSLAAPASTSYPAGRSRRWRAHGVGFVFQFYNLMPVLSAEGNVELPLLLTKLSAAQRRENVAVALEVVGLADRAKRLNQRRSCLAARQRVAIAPALVSDPQLLVSAMSRPAISIARPTPMKSSACCRF